MNLNFLNSLKSRKYTLSKIVFPVMLISALFPTNCYANSNLSVDVADDEILLHSGSIDMSIPKEEFINLVSLEGDKIVFKDNGYSLEIDKSDLCTALVNNIEDRENNNWLQGYIIGIVAGGAVVLTLKKKTKR